MWIGREDREMERQLSYGERQDWKCNISERHERAELDTLSLPHSVGAVVVSRLQLTQIDSAPEHTQTLGNNGGLR